MAASELCVTPSAVSHQIAGLERQLGTKLFERKHRRLVLTDRAQAFHRTVGQAFAEIGGAIGALKGGDVVDVVRVHCEPSFAPAWLLPDLGQFQSDNPDIELSVHASPEPADFLTDDVDLEIRFGKGQWPEVRANLLLLARITPLCSPSLRARMSARPSAEEVAGFPLIISERSAVTWAEWLSAAGASRPLRRASLRFDRGYLSIQAAASGLGIALEDAVFADRELRQGSLVTLFDQDPLGQQFGHYVAVSKRRVTPPKTQRVIEWITNRASQPAPWRDH